MSWWRRKAKSWKRPEKYNVTITVQPAENSDVELKLELTGIQRSDIMSPNYGQPLLRSLVEQIEGSVQWES